MDYCPVVKVCSIKLSDCLTHAMMQWNIC